MLTWAYLTYRWCDKSSDKRRSMKFQVVFFLCSLFERSHHSARGVYREWFDWTTQEESCEGKNPRQVDHILVSYRVNRTTWQSIVQTQKKLNFFIISSDSCLLSFSRPHLRDYMTTCSWDMEFSPAMINLSHRSECLICGSRDALKIAIMHGSLRVYDLRLSELKLTLELEKTTLTAR